MSGFAIRWPANGTVATELQRGTATGPNARDEARAINDAGVAVGQIDLTNEFGLRPVRWDPGGTSYTQLDVFGTTLSGDTHGEAESINAAGTAAGYAEDYDSQGNFVGVFAVRWEASGTAATKLDNLPGTIGGIGWAINASGTVVGIQFGASGQLPARWNGSGTTVTDLGTLGTDSSGSTFGGAFKINSAGTAIGYVEKFDESHTDLGSRAVLWNALDSAANELANLGTDLDGYTSTLTSAISNAGYIVGEAEAFDEDGNDLGSRAVYWNPDGTVVDLNTLIDPDSGWLLTNATAISDTGWIAGIGNYDPDGSGGQDAYQRLFVTQILATAVPEPCTFLLAATGLISALVCATEQSLIVLASKHC